MPKFFAGLTQPTIKLPVHHGTLSIPMKRQVREQYVENQKGKCWYCRGSLGSEPPVRFTTLYIDEALFPRGFFDHPVHLHHDHDTGFTLGAVHAWCNAILWQYDRE